MSSNLPKSLTFYLIAVSFFLTMPGLCAQDQLTELQKQARIYRDQGLELQKEGNIDEALPYYQKALLLDPNYVVAYNDVGIIFEARGQPGEARKMYLKTIEIAPNYPNSYSNLALFYEAQGDYTNAILCWMKRAVLGGSGDPWAEVARKRLEDIARIYPEAFRKIGEQEQFKEPSQELGNKARARDYLEHAKKSFSRRDYVTALKNATQAGYFDPSNEEISAFVDKIRKALLR